MSSFHKVVSEIRDQHGLADAITQLGYEGVQTHEQAVDLTNAWGRGHGVSKAEVLIRAKSITAKHAGYNRSDVGFKRQADGTFALQVNDMDASVFNEEWLGEVKTRMGIARAIRMAKRQYGCAKPLITERVVAGKKQTTVKSTLS